MTTHNLPKEIVEQYKYIHEPLTRFSDNLIWVLYRDKDQEIIKENKITRDDLRSHAFGLFVATGVKICDLMIEKGAITEDIKQEFIKRFNLMGQEPKNPEYDEYVKLLTQQAIETLTTVGDGEEKI